jgi:hypothetical protein
MTDYGAASARATRFLRNVNIATRIILVAGLLRFTLSDRLDADIIATEHVRQTSLSRSTIELS